MLTATTLLLFCLIIGFSKSQFCSLETIIDNQPSDICTITEITVYENAPQPSSFPAVLTSMAAFAGLAGPGGQIAAAFTTTLVAALDNGEDAELQLDRAFETAVNQAIQDVVACIGIEIDANNAEQAKDRLTALTLQFQDLAEVNEFDFSDSHKLVIDGLRTFIDEEFRDPTLFTRREFSLFLPVFRATTNFYAVALTSFLAYTRIDCDQNNDEVNCARFDDYVGFGYYDIQQLSSWVKAARNDTLDAHTPKALQSEISAGNCITQRRNVGDIDTDGFGHIFRTRMGFAIDTIRIDMSSFDVEAYDPNPGAGDFEDPDYLTIELDISTNAVSLSCIAQTNYLCTASYSDGNGPPPGNVPTRTETPTFDCCFGIKSKVALAISWIKIQVENFTDDFNLKYVQQLQDLKLMLDSI